jgi:hypothetical protein
MIYHYTLAFILSAVGSASYVDSPKHPTLIEYKTQIPRI